MWRALVANLLTLAIVGLVVAAGVIAWGRAQFTGPGPLTEAVCVRVERGANLATVSRALEAQGAISDARIMRIGAGYSDHGRGLRFGSYLVPEAASMVDILDILTRGGQSTCGAEVNYLIGVVNTEVILRELDPATRRYEEMLRFDPAGEEPADYLDAVADPALRYRVTVAEGATSWQVAEGLRHAGFLSGEVEAMPGEGWLAPDSYEVAPGSERMALLDEMEARQRRILEELWAERDEELPYGTMEEALIMASIIEKETGVPDERRQVASVFVNRLRQGMRLQTDPTVIYGITGGQGVLGRGIRQSELRAATPYNTYVIDGMPPTPIANPGRASIAAALNPDDTPYIFFVADGTGGHAFAVTLDEHNANVAKWREIEAERARQQQEQAN